MASATSRFEQWLKATEQRTHGLELADALGVVAGRARDALGARLWFVEILGRRWSYIAGERAGEPVAAPIERVPLGAHVGLVADGWGSLSKGEVGRLLAFLGRLVEEEQAP